MPAHVVTFTHSRMRSDYVGKVVKYANTREDAIKLLGKYDKRAGVIIDKRGSVLTLIENDK